MIVFHPASGTLASDTYGWDGQKELRAFAKKKRLDRSAIRGEGHPADEHYIVPPPRRDSFASMTSLRVIDAEELRELRVNKTAVYRDAQNRTKPAPIMAKVKVAWEAPDEDSLPVRTGRKRFKSFDRDEELAA